jgi:hypothetical protein
MALLRRLAGHHILDEANNGRDNGAGDAAADGLPDHRADIDIAGRALQHRQQSGEQRPAARAADGAGNGIAERAEVDVLHRGACGIAADGAGDELDDEIDQRS